MRECYSGHNYPDLVALARRSRSRDWPPHTHHILLNWKASILHSPYTSDTTSHSL